MTTPAIEAVPREIPYSETETQFVSGLVRQVEVRKTRMTQDYFGPMDWVRLMKRVPVPDRKADANQDSMITFIAVAVLLFALAITVAASTLPKGGSTAGHGLIVALMMITTSVALTVRGLMFVHSNAANTFLTALFAAGAINNARQKHYGWAALNAAQAASAGRDVYRRHRVNESERSQVLMANYQYWNWVEEQPLPVRWEKAQEFYLHLRNQGAEVLDYPQAVAYLRAHPQIW